MTLQVKLKKKNGLYCFAHTKICLCHTLGRSSTNEKTSLTTNYKETEDVLIL